MAFQLLGGKKMEHIVTTKRREEMVEITSLIQEEVMKSEVKNGIVVVYVPHTTAAVTINENADPDVVDDILYTLAKTYPVDPNYKHFEGNSDAHIKASLFGSSVTIIIEEGKLKLGVWQGVYFCDFDGPRNRKLYIKIIKG